MRKNIQKKIELLAPAGDFDKLKMAVNYGANAVYLAGNTFGMRSFAGNFSPEELKLAVEYCHSRNVHVHVTCNTMPRSDEMKNLPQWLEHVQSVGVDAIILADLGVLSLAKKYAANTQLHISTQASIVNADGAKAYHDLGASRVILARELSLKEIADIRQNTPDSLEIEAFVHGSMCVSYSGRCLLSNYMTGRDSNRGSCAQPCRYQYALVEEKRPGEYFHIEEDDKNTYIMNSHDMCMIDNIQELIDVGLDSLKIEGRAKSTYYAGVITGAYRQALDAVYEGRELDPIWRDEVEHVSHRPYSTGFFYGQPGQQTDRTDYCRSWQVVALITECDVDGNAILSLRNKFGLGAELELVGPNIKPHKIAVDQLWDEQGEVLDEVRHPEMIFKMKLPQQVPALSLLRRAEG